MEIADKAFREHGVSASLDDIAGRAGVGPGTLYRHFPTRDDLILALVAADLERLAALANQLAGDDDPDAVQRWLAALVDHNLTYRGLAETIIAVSGKSTQLGTACAALRHAGATLVAAAQAAGTIRTDIDPDDVFELAAAVAWITENGPDHRRRDPVMTIVIDGIRRTH